MIYTAIGLIVGVIMGLTGAGGALISIPLFISLLDSSLKEATVLSLVAVVFGTAVNLLGQVTKINKKIAFSLSFVGVISNYLSLPVKSEIPEKAIAGILTLIGIYSIVSVWKKNKNLIPEKKEGPIHFKALIAGSFLGLITTLTGLGGGVILVPLLIKAFGNKYEEALPTSLATILLISLSSLILQSETALTLINANQLALLGAGALVAYFVLKFFLKRFEEAKVLQARRIVFSMVTVYSVLSVIIKTL